MRTDDDDEDEMESWRGEPDDSMDEEPDAADLAAEGGTVPCVHCRRPIHEDAEICNYCHHWQTDECHPPRKPLWYVITVVVVVAGIALVWIGLAYLKGWHF